MITWWHYLLLVNLYLVLFFAFYKAFLGRETFFQLNRAYLVAASLLSFFIPVMQSDWVRHLFITEQIHQRIYSTVSPEFIYHLKPVESNPVTLGQIIAILYIIGAAVLLSRLAYQLYSLKRLVNRDNGMEAFSFFKKIKVDQNLPARETIVAHEQVHISQWHSADILLIEIVMIINWFNPVVYLYRKAIKHVHEFIADRKAIQNGTPPAEYAMLLLSQTFGAVPHQLTNNFFNHSLLKQRIKMLSQTNSKRRALLKYGLSAPLFVLMLVLSSATVDNSRIIKIINKKTENVFAIHFKTAVDTNAIKEEVTVTNVPVAILPKPNVIPNSNVIEDNQAAADTIPKDKNVFTAVEISPTFPGGTDAFYKYLATNLRYPAEARKSNVSGRVFISFIVEMDGALSDIKLLRDPGAGLGAEALRVLAASPKWTPGIQNGRFVRVQYTVPVNFSLDNGGVKKEKDTVGYVQPAKGPLMITFTPKATAKQPLYVIDGKIMPASEFKTLKTENIESIYVIKADSLKASIYGEAGKNGVIVVNSKDARTQFKNR